MKWAFSDESQRGDRYVIAAVVFKTHAANAARASLRQFLRANQRRVHMTKESAARRRQFLSLVESLVAGAFVVEAQIGQSRIADVRAAAMAALARQVIDDGVTTWLVEWMVEASERRDRHVIAQVVLESDPPADLSYDHRQPHEEPLLWAADAVAWAASRRPLDWARTVTLP